MHKPTKLIIGFALLLLGTNLITYGLTRYRTTSVVLKTAGEETILFLERNGYWVTSPQITISAEKQLEAKKLYGKVTGAGGMYYGWHEALLVIALGILVAITGALIPFVTKGEPLDVELDDEES